MLQKLWSLRVAVPAVLSLTLVAAGCSSERTVDATCPAATGLVEASSLTRFAPGAAPDPAHALFHVELTGVHRDCTLDNKKRIVDGQLTVNFRATRSPSAAPADYEVPYFVAISSGADIFAKQVFMVHFHFDAGQAETNFSDHVDSVVIHVANDKQVFDYQILTGLQLTQEELEYSRKNGLYAP